MRELVFSPSAREDLRQIVEYVGDAAGVDVAAEVIRRIREKCRLIAETPGTIGTGRDELRSGVRSFAAKPYVLFFRYTDSTVEIIRVLHGRQDVESAF